MTARRRTARPSPSPPGSAPKRLLTTAEVARILELSEARVREIVRAGLVRPTRSGRAYAFTFQDLVVLRTAQGLLAARVPAGRMKRALAALARQLPDGRPASALRVYADGRDVVVRDERGPWQPETGQRLFAFDVATIERRLGHVVPADEVTRAAGESRRAAAPGRAGRPRAAATPSAAAACDGAAGARASFTVAVELEDRDVAAARVAYQRAIALDPNFADAYVNLGRLAHEAGDRAEAARLYGRALVLDETDPIVHYNLAMVLEESPATREAARVHYERAVVLDPAFADAHWNLAALCERLGHARDALRHYAAYRRLSKES